MVTTYSDIDTLRFRQILVGGGRGGGEAIAFLWNNLVQEHLGLQGFLFWGTFVLEPSQTSFLFQCLSPQVNVRNQPEDLNEKRMENITYTRS